MLYLKALVGVMTEGVITNDCFSSFHQNLNARGLVLGRRLKFLC